MPAIRPIVGRRNDVKRMMPARFPPGSRGFVAAIVIAQVLTQIGAFTLPALLPHYIERWSLSKTEAGWLIGIFFAAYVPAVPVLLALTDRVPARRIYLIGTGLTALSHWGFAMLADGFWSGFLMGDVSPNRRKFRQVKFSLATIASRSITCPLSRKV